MLLKHHKFDPNTILNDVALLKLSRPVTLNPNIQIACLPLKKSKSFPPVNSPVIVVGWGETSANSSTSNTLQNLKMTVFDGQKNCKEYSNTNWQTQICSGVLSNKKGICFGGFPYREII